MQILKKLKETRGDLIGVGTVVGLIVFCACLSLTMSVLPIYHVKQTMDTGTTEIVRYIEMKGCVNSDVYSRITEIKDAMGINFNCKINGNYIGGTQKIQLEDTFSVTLEYDTQFGAGGMLAVPITIRCVQTGVSEKYYK